MVIAAAAVALFVPLPLVVRLPYVCVETDWLEPLYSTVLVALSVRVAELAGKPLVPPIFNVAPAPTVRVPPDDACPAVNVLRSRIPPETVRFPLFAIVRF